MSQKEISRAVIKRLPRYYRFLEELMKAGVERISSRELSQRMCVTASQIRQDLNHFGGFGQQGYGYNVQFLYDEIGRILGLDRNHNMIIIGGGNLGQTLANYANFEKSKFHVIGIFDKKEELKGKVVRGVEIRPMEEIPSFLASHQVDIATLTLPKLHAVEVARMLVDNGIRAIWNFAHTDLNLYLPDDIVIENVHLSESLMRLSYNLVNRDQE